MLEIEVIFLLPIWQNLCYRWNRWYKVESIQYDKRNKWIKTLIWHISRESRSTFAGRKWNASPKMEYGSVKSVKKAIKHHTSKDYAWNSSLCACECDKDWNIGDYLKTGHAQKIFIMF